MAPTARWSGLEGGRRAGLARTILVIALLAVMSGPAGPALGQDPPADLLGQRAEELAELRVEVDRLDAELRAVRRQGAFELRTLQTRRGELELQLDDLRLEVRTQRDEAEQLHQRQREQGDAGSELADTVERGLDELGEVIAEGMPYHRDERLAALDDLRGQLRAGRIDPASAAVSLWRTIDDDLRLAERVERGQTPLQLRPGDAVQLVEVVRLGSVALLVHVPPDEYGRVIRGEDGSWCYEPLTHPEPRRQVRKLFRDLQRQIRDGAYILPLQADGSEDR